MTAVQALSVELTDFHNLDALGSDTALTAPISQQHLDGDCRADRYPHQNGYHLASEPTLCVLTASL